MRVTSAEFIKSASDSSGYPEEGLPEAAFAGRSNVGKSSLINKLVSRKKLAKTSSTPGHTRLVNFFRVNDKVVLADLPGYGYAKASIKERERWKRMVEEYLVNRRELKAVVIIVDIRRAPGQEEKDLVAFLTGEGITPVLVATKADKLGKTRRLKPLREISEASGVPLSAIVTFSARTGEGRDELWARLRNILDF